MKITKALLNFGTYSDAKLLTFANAVVAGMSGNKFFPTLDNDTATLKGATAEYGISLDAAKSGNRTSIAAKNAKKAEVVNTLKGLAINVNLIAAGNKEMLASSNLELSQNNGPSVLTAPVLEIQPVSINGQFNAVVKQATHAKSYLLQLALDPQMKQVTDNISSTERKISITGLESGNRYYMRVQAIGSRKQSLWSAIVSRVAQ